MHREATATATTITTTVITAEEQQRRRQENRKRNLELLPLCGRVSAVARNRRGQQRAVV
jgi:hypothetical protein